MELVKKRGKKVTQEQKEVIVNFLETHPLLIAAKIEPQQQQLVEDKWQELKTTLNAVDNGAKKELSVWKSTIADWKCKVRKVARLKKEGFKKTGGGGYANEELSDLDNRLIRLFGLVSVLGCDEIPPEIDPDEAADIFHDQCLTPPPPATSSECTQKIEETVSCKNTTKVLKVESGRIQKPIKKPTRRNVNALNKLEISAGKHLAASTQIAHSIDNLGRSVGELASAFNKIAEAIVLLATAKEFSA